MARGIASSRHQTFEAGPVGHITPFPQPGFDRIMRCFDLALAASDGSAQKDGGGSLADCAGGNLGANGTDLVAAIQIRPDRNPAPADTRCRFALTNKIANQGVAGDLNGQSEDIGCVECPASSLGHRVSHLP